MSGGPVVASSNLVIPTFLKLKGLHENVSLFLLLAVKEEMFRKVAKTLYMDEKCLRHVAKLFFMRIGSFR
jgi:hypothetical protein